VRACVSVALPPAPPLGLGDLQIVLELADQAVTRLAGIASSA
jgi:hypothetical protein